jgi:hypothetical protein
MRRVLAEEEQESAYARDCHGSSLGRMISAEFTIDRTSFGINGSRWSGGATVLSKDVNIHLAIGAIRHGSQ